MSGFSPDWLAMREPADLRSRDGLTTIKLAQALQRRPDVRVVDLGCGTGSNVRATYAALGPVQHWTLVDVDAQLLAVARGALSNWAEAAKETRDGILLEKSGKRLTISFVHADLTHDLDRVLGEKPDLVTAAALFDLCSASFVETMASAVSARRAVFYTTLTFNGVQRWTPAHPADDAIHAAFLAHQRTDKGFGRASGPDAPVALRRAFQGHGYEICEGDSAWLLSRSDKMLIDALVQGYAGAVAETGVVTAEVLADWLSLERRGAEIGHTDTLALPPVR